MHARNVQLLLVGGESDPNTQRLVDQAHLRGLDYFFWNTDDPSCCQIAWDFSTPVIDLGGDSIKPESTFLRYNVFDGDPTRNQHAVETIESFALAWPAIRMLNRKTSGNANNKSRNLTLARDLGFPIPNTTVLADLSPLATLPDPYQRIIKPLSGGDHAAVVKDVNSDLDRLSVMAPQFLQEKLEGENLRVFSISGNLFAFHLETNQVDYRTDQHVRVHAMEVPESLIRCTHQLVDRIGFDYCALDFRCKKGFEHPIFLEINSFPMFVAFDDAAENRLADAILEFLIGQTA